MPSGPELEAPRVLKGFAGEQNVTTHVLIKPYGTEKCRRADHKWLSLPAAWSDEAVVSSDTALEAECGGSSSLAPLHDPVLTTVCQRLQIQ